MTSRRRRKKRCIRILAWILVPVLCIGVVLAVPFWRSLVVMRIYSAYQAKGSLTEKVSLTISGGEGWYPFVMTFQDDAGFSAWSGEQARLTVLYNFPAYPHWYSASSSLYDPRSPYYNGFYGAYLVEREDGGAYGFNEDGSIDSEAVAKVPEYDFHYLVLADFGLRDEDWRFDWSVYSTEENVEYLGIPGWVRMRAHLTVPGVYHQAERYVMSYLQYGRPKKLQNEEPFAPVTMEGLIYGRYFPECGVSVFFYCLGRDPELVEQTDRKILSQSFLEAVADSGEVVYNRED